MKQNLKEVFLPYLANAIKEKELEKIPSYNDKLEIILDSIFQKLDYLEIGVKSLLIRVQSIEERINEQS